MGVQVLMKYHYFHHFLRISNFNLQLMDTPNGKTATLEHHCGCYMCIYLLNSAKFSHSKGDMYCNMKMCILCTQAQFIHAGSHFNRYPFNQVPIKLNNSVQTKLIACEVAKTSKIDRRLHSTH